jgi:N-acetylglucosamine-6-phosphate deacetylase
MIIKNASAFTEDGRFIKKNIFVEGERFSDGSQSGDCQSGGRTDGECSGDTIIDASSCYVITGLVDIHLHGCDGVDFCDGTTKSIEKILAYETKHGITTVVPATMTLAEDELMKIMKVAAEYRREATKVELSYFHGINMEGPFVSAKKYRGVSVRKYSGVSKVDIYCKNGRVEEVRPYNI